MAIEAMTSSQSLVLLDMVFNELAEIVAFSIDPIIAKSMLARFNEEAANSLHLKSKRKVQRIYFSFDTFANSLEELYGLF